MNSTKQRGMVLLVSLVLLLMLTLIAITASNQATLQLRISSNSEQRTQAFQAAEAGIARWVGAYFKIPLEDLIKVGDVTAAPLDEASSIAPTAGTKAGIDAKKSHVGPCPGVSLSSGPPMHCFNLTVIGESVCDEHGECEVETIHRQGGQRRGAIQQQ